jgi:hypothetical protein
VPFGYKNKKLGHLVFERNFLDEVNAKSLGLIPKCPPLLVVCRGRILVRETSYKLKKK